MNNITVVGGGIAGLTAAISAAEKGSSVRVLEERSELGGRARTAPPPYRANLGPHALYSNGVFWEWLEVRNLLPTTVNRGAARLHYRRRGDVTDRSPELEAALGAIIGRQAPADTSFREWAEPLAGGEGRELLEGFACIPTFDADAGRLSAAFVHERIRRAIQPGVVHYVVGGWQALVDRLASEAKRLGVAIETRHKVTSLPAPPVVVATGHAAAARLLGEPKPQRHGTRIALLDLGLEGDATLPSSLLDVDERLYLARYTAFDRSLAPPNEELVQIVCSCHAGERLTDTLERIESVLDSLAPTWRRQLRWSRNSLLTDATGAVDLPGRTWKDRPPVTHAHGIYRAGDYVAAPGFLSEVSFKSGQQAGIAADDFLQQHASREHRASWTRTRL